MKNAATEADPYLFSTLSGHVRWLTLNRAARRNPLSGEMIRTLGAALAEADDDIGTRVVVLAAEGPVFCAGHDLREMSAGSDAAEQEQAQRQVLDACSRMMLAMVNMGTPVIACVQGTATAAGCQLMSSCDLAIASDQAQFCLPGVNIGSFCTTPLVAVGRKMSRKHAMELALTGDMFPAEDAWRMGLVNRVVPHAELHAQTEALAQKIASRSSQGIRSGKQAFYQQMDMPLEEAYSFATQKMIEAHLTEDSAEGTSAFFEKRSPRWSGLEE